MTRPADCIIMIMFVNEANKSTSPGSFNRKVINTGFIREEKMKSYIAKPNEVERKWYVVDAAGKPLGRVASRLLQY